MFSLIKNGKLSSAVVYSTNRDAVDNNAVAEYCLFVRFCTDKDVVASPSIPSGYDNLVFIGSDNEHLEKYGIKIPKETFDDDTVYILVKDNILVLDGGARGKLYAVYEFLERFLGVRFYSVQKAHTPKYKDLDIDNCEIIYTPKIRFRETYSTDLRFDRLYAARLRHNSSNFALAKENLGGGMKWASPASHTTFSFLMTPEDPETGFDKHPEYYSYIKSQGKRVGRHHNELGFPWGEGELCFSNGEVIDVLTERVKTWILDQSDKEIFSISQNDWPEHCECDKCTAIAEKYGKDGEPRWSAPIIYAINEIAKRIKNWQKTDQRVKDRRIYLETFAYHYGTEPPIGLEVEDNVLVRLCTHECCFYHSLDDESCKINGLFRNTLIGWKNICKNICIWDYTNNHCMEIAFNTILPNLQKNARYFAANNVIGLFSEFNGKYYHTGLYPEVRQYLIAQVMWNPDINYEEEFKGAMEFFYKEAAPYIMQVENEFVKNTAKLPLFHPRLAYTILKDHYTDEFLINATELFEKALSVAKTAELELRIKRDYIWLKFIKMYFNRSKDKEQMDAVVKECEYLGVSFSKMDAFIRHYYHGQKEDLFLEEIDERNKKYDMEKLMEILR